MEHRVAEVFQILCEGHFCLRRKAANFCHPMEQDNQKEIIPYIGYLISCISYTNFFFLLQIFWILEKNGYKRNPNHKLERHSAKTRKTEFVYWTL